MNLEYNLIMMRHSFTTHQLPNAFNKPLTTSQYDGLIPSYQAFSSTGFPIQYRNSSILNKQTQQISTNSSSSPNLFLFPQQSQLNIKEKSSIISLEQNSTNKKSQSVKNNLQNIYLYSTDVTALSEKIQPLNAYGSAYSFNNLSPRKMFISQNNPNNKNNQECQTYSDKWLESNTFCKNSQILHHTLENNNPSFDQSFSQSFSRSYKDYVCELLSENQKKKEKIVMLEYQNAILKTYMQSNSKNISFQNTMNLQTEYLKKLKLKNLELQERKLIIQKQLKQSLKKLRQELEQQIRINEALKSLICQSKEAELIVAKNKISQLERILQNSSSLIYLDKLQATESKLREAEEHIKEITVRYNQLDLNLKRVQFQHLNQNMGLKHQNQNLKNLLRVEYGVPHIQKGKNPQITLPQYSKLLKYEIA